MNETEHFGQNIDILPINCILFWTKSLYENMLNSIVLLFIN